MGTKVYDNALDLITFSRNSGGTSLRKISYGDELVTNGTFGAGSDDWVQSGAGINTFASVDYNDSLKVTIIDPNTTTTLTVSQTATNLNVGSVYFVSADFSHFRNNPAATNFGIKFVGQDLNFGSAYKTGTFTSFFVATSITASLFEVYARRFASGTAGDFVEFDNISVKEVLFDQPDGTLQLFYHPADIPRIDYSPDGTAKGLLIEEQRTNNITNSEACAFVDESGGTVTDSTTSAPYGMSSTVKRIQSSVLNGGGKLPVTILTGGDNYCSVYVRSRTGSDQNLKIAASGTVGATQVAPASGDWVRLGRVASLGAGNRDMRVLSIGDAIDIDIALPQVEFGSFPTSYIPTSGSTVTRAADVASIPVSAFGYNQSVGSLVIQYAPIFPYNGPYIAQLDDNTVSNRIYFQMTGANPSNITVGSIGAVTNIALALNDVFDDSQNVKIGVGIKQNDCALSVDGSSPVLDTSYVESSIAFTNLRIGYFPVGDSQQANGHIKSIQYFPRRLTNAQLQELTT